MCLASPNRYLLQEGRVNNEGTAMVTILLYTFLGSIIAMISNASLLYAGHLVARRFFKDEPASVRWVAFGLVSAWLVIVLSVALIFTHVFTVTGVTISSIGIAGFAWFFWGRHSSLRQELTGVHAFILPYIRGRSAVLFLAVFFIVIFQAIRALMMPPVSWDSLTYHMTLAGLWVQNGGYARLLAPDAWDCYSHFPNHGEVFFGWLMVPFRSDLLVNLGNFPFFILGVLTVYGLARELGIDKDTSLLSSACVCLSPPLFAYITTQYVDIQSFSEGLCGVFFLVRYARSGQPRDSIMAFAAFGLAAGTKVTMLQLLLLTCAITLGLSLWKRMDGKKLLIMALGILFVTGAAAAPWYVRNWIETGSPLYPFSLSIRGIEIFPGSKYMDTVISSLEAKIRYGIHESLLYWLKVFNFDGKFCLNFGPKFVLVVAGGIAGLIMGLRSSNRVQWLIIGIISCSEFVQFMSKGMRVTRLGWMDGSQRFLMLFFALAVISGIWLLVKARKLKQPLVILLICFAILDLLVIHNNSISGMSPLAKGKHYFFTMAVFIILTFFYYASDRITKFKMPLIVTFVILGVIILPLLQCYRDCKQYLRFMDSVDLQEVPCVDAVPGWKFIDDPSRPTTIAVTTACRCWFLYPLMGRRLQNRLVYISPAQPGELVSYVPGLDSFKRVEVSAWIARMREAGVDRVFVIIPAPPELAWIEDNPNFFKLLQATQDYRIYEVIR